MQFIFICFKRFHDFALQFCLPSIKRGFCFNINVFLPPQTHFILTLVFHFKENGGQCQFQALALVHTFFNCIQFKFVAWFDIHQIWYLQPSNRIRKVTYLLLNMLKNMKKALCIRTEKYFKTHTEYSCPSHKTQGFRLLLLIK